jgi:hypothetical protein
LAITLPAYRLPRQISGLLDEARSGPRRATLPAPMPDLKSREKIMAYLLGEIQTIDKGSDFYGVGFSILDRNGTPVVSFGYLDGGDAVKAHSLIKQAISEAKYVASPG